MISESASESNTMSSPPITTKTKEHNIKIIRKKTPKNDVDRGGQEEEEEAPDQRSSSKESKRRGDHESDDDKANHLNKKIKSKTAEVTVQKVDKSSKLESHDKQEKAKHKSSHTSNTVVEKVKSSKSGSSSKVKERKRYEEVKIDGFTINAFRTWEDLQDELNDRISANIIHNGDNSCPNSDRPNTSFSNSLVSAGDTSDPASELHNGPSSSGLIRSSGLDAPREVSKNLLDAKVNLGNTNAHDRGERANTEMSIEHEPDVNQSNQREGDQVRPVRKYESIIPGEVRNDGDHRNHHHHRDHSHRRHHDSKHSKSHSRDDIHRQYVQAFTNPEDNDLMRFSKAMCDPLKGSGHVAGHQQQPPFFPARPPSSIYPQRRSPSPPASGPTAHQYFQQYQQLYQQMHNSTNHHMPPLHHQHHQQAPPPPLPHQQPLPSHPNPYMQSLINQHQQNLHHLTAPPQHQPPPPPLPPAPPMPMPYMSPYTITDTIHTISRQTIIPPAMMGPPPPASQLPLGPSPLASLDSLASSARYGSGLGPSAPGHLHLGALEHHPLSYSHHQQQHSSYMPSPTERSFMEFARSYANASNMSSNYSNFMSQNSSAGKSSAASFYNQLDRMALKSEHQRTLSQAYGGSSSMSPFPGAFPGAAVRPPMNGWRLPGW